MSYFVYVAQIEDLKQKNSELNDDIASYKELLKFEEKELSFVHSKLSTLEDIDLDNDDLSLQITKYKQLLKQLKLENVSLKNENKKYKVALESYDQQKQKREEIHANHRLNLQNKIKELQEENESLLLDLSAMNQFGSRSSKSISATSYSNLRDESILMDGFMRIKNLKSPTKHATAKDSISNIQSDEYSKKTYDNFIFQRSTTNLNDYYAFNASTISLNHNIVDEKCANCKLINQSMTKEYDFDEYLAKIDEYELIIKKLKREVTSLKFKNKQLIERLDSRFKCGSMEWFSDLIYCSNS